MLPSVIVGLLIGAPAAPEPAPRALMAALQAITVSQGDAGKTGEYQQGFQIVFSARRGRAARADYPLLANPLLGAGKRVVITVTIQARPRVLIDGIITHQQLAGDNEPVITLTGKDLTVLMDMVQAGERRPGQGDKEAALAIIGKYTAYGIKPQASDPATNSPATEDQRVPIQVATDLAHLRALAKSNGFIFYLRPGPTEKQSIAYWGAPPRDGQAQRALTTRMGAGTNVDALSFSYDSLAPTQVTGSYTDPDKAEATPLQALERKGGVALGKTQALKAGAEFVRKRRLYDTPFDAAQSLAQAQAAANRSAERTLVAKGKLETTRYGDLLVAPGVVGMRGAGKTYDGEYYVAKVTHKITPESYVQEFELSREGTGSTTETVKVK
jgi:hypothetical protein